MTDKVTLTNLVNLQNESTAVNAINANSAALTTAIDNTLSRDGTAPNQMGASLDMNSNKVINLGAPVNPNDGVRLTDIGTAVASGVAAAASAASASASASTATTQASTATTQAGISTTQAGISTTQAGISTTQAGISTTQAGNAATSATTATTAASSITGGITDTSVTSNTIGTGSKTFTISASKLFIVGQFVTIVNTPTPSNFMHGQITSYTSTTLIVNVLDIGGSGTFTAWTISVSGPQGTPGSGSISGMTTHGIPIAATTTSVTSSLALTDAQLIVGQTGADPLPKTITGDVTFTAAGATAIGATKVTNAMLAGSIDLTTKVTGVLPVSNGGIGVGTLTGIPKGSGTSAFTAATVGTDYVAPGTTSNFTIGFTATSFSGGTITGAGQTYTPAAASGNFQHITLNGSSLTGTFTFAVPSSVCTIIVEVVNGGAGAVASTLSTAGYSKVTGDSWSSTNGNKYQFFITKSNSGSSLAIQALQ